MIYDKLDTLKSLIVISSIPFLVCIFLYFQLRKEKYNHISYTRKQLIAGIVFGCLAIIATEYGVPVAGSIINVRDASPICAGLFFGPWAGIIAGIIGGVERWFCVYWGGGHITRLACSISTVLAGFIAAYLRKYIFEDKIPHWLLALYTGIFCETLHMVMIIMTNVYDIRFVFNYVEACSQPMIIVNSVTVGLTAFLLQRIENDVTEIKPIPTISSQYQNNLILVVIVGLLLTYIMTRNVQRHLANRDFFDLVALNAGDVYGEVQSNINYSMIRTAREIAEDYYVDLKGKDLSWLASYYGVTEAMVVNDEGIVIDSSEPAYFGADLNKDLVTSELFKKLSSQRSASVGPVYMTINGNNVKRKSVGYKYNDSYIVVSNDVIKYNEMLDEEIRKSADNRRIGESGSLLIADKNGVVIADGFGLEGKKLEDLNIDVHVSNYLSYNDYTVTIDGTTYYYTCTNNDDYYFCALIPESELNFSKTLSVYLSVFTLILVSGLQFIAIYYVTKRLIVNNLDRVNDSLEKITGGDLETVVDVESNEEFLSLSNGINMTVDSLKQFIKEANERIDAELRTARAIQMSALPSSFPAFPDYDQFDLYAIMDPAKEVGGDFYDFYMINDHTVAFLVADVSGKGIPGSLFMMRAKTTIRNFADAGDTPAEIMTKANEKLCEGNDAGMFVTAWMAFLDLNNGELTFANAGHNPPLLRRKDGEFEYLKMVPGFVLAGMEGIRFKENKIILEPGDELFLYTDGVVEATDVDKQLYGEDRLIRCLNDNIGKDVREMCSCVKKDVDTFYEGAPQFDDITELSFKFISYRK
ncbi:MAG: SpoIIE family protein phosphatase [Erysipelotrichaceae bacterium]|nr:SpoIIE family protein phosphatase [Erysipelotrichaceae bacterium]